MPKVRCFEIPGLRCWFWSNDHDPPHFHIKQEGKWELKVKFAEGERLMFELKWGDRPKAKVYREIEEIVKEKRVQLLAEWEANVNKWAPVH